MSVNLLKGTLPLKLLALAAAIVRLLTDAEQRRTLGAMLRRRAEDEFSWDAITRRLLDVYCRVARPLARHSNATQS